MNTQDADTIRAAGLKVTAPRLAVLRALRYAPHSDADQVFRMVEPELTATSRQAVYGVLGAFTEAGLARRIEPAGSPARYELRVGDNHHHLVCTGCGRVEDVDCVHGAAPCLVPSQTQGFAIAEAEVTFWGRCVDCVVTEAAGGTSDRASDIATASARP
ncbi:Fur family transcriptional regulator [Ruicaihuangia caeni]|uniref:Fur family transcriptional regulator n=1 Tax=Ruicaihuangia caeni TaxID=3042517 RepID=A0AAW6T3V1_9MICO|nr:Fur family transcriptional regulator [Klugiella sp. YN-L-19]MDI2098392.1 Fur family transcriptional regulator [Klugiella sp. YN-L-19]